jgi:hypothetical protein
MRPEALARRSRPAPLTLTSVKPTSSNLRATALLSAKLCQKLSLINA